MASHEKRQKQSGGIPGSDHRRDGRTGKRGRSQAKMGLLRIRSKYENRRLVAERKSRLAQQRRRAAGRYRNGFLSQELGRGPGAPSRVFRTTIHINHILIIFRRPVFQTGVFVVVSRPGNIKFNRENLRRCLTFAQFIFFSSCPKISPFILS